MFFLIGGCVSRGVYLSDISGGVRKPDEQIVYKRAGGQELKMFVFYPQGHKPSDKRVGIVCIHGGGWVGGSADTFFPHARYFAMRGAVVFSIDYRLVSRDGKPNSSGKTNYIWDCVTDCKSAVRYIRQNAQRFGIDPERIVSFGDSAGGHLSACLGTIDEFDAPDEDKTVSSKVNAMVPCNGFFDMTTKAIKNVADVAGPNEPNGGLTHIERARRVSPLFHITKDTPPGLLLHGVDDQVVSCEQAKEFADAMRKAGHRCDLKLYPNTKHAFVLIGYRAPDEQIVRAIRDADEFLVSLGWLKGEPLLKDTKYVQPPKKLIANFKFDAVNDGNTSDAVNPVFSAKVNNVKVINDNERGRIFKFTSKVSDVIIEDFDAMGFSSSVSMWIKPAKFGGILARRKSILGFSVLGFSLSLEKNGSLELAAGGAKIETGAKVIEKDKWTNVIVAIGNKKASIYVDGKAYANKDELDVRLNGTSLEIGTNGFEGLIDDVRIYNYELSADDVKKIFAGRE